MKPAPYIALSFFLTLGLSRSIYGQSVTEQILGNWRIDFPATFEKMPEAAKAHFTALPQRRRTRIEQAYKGRQIQFSSGNHYRQALSQGQVKVGTWAYHAEGQTITVASPEGREYRFKLISLSPSSLVLELQTTSGGTPYFKEICYLRTLN